jgi:hypothetical protein
MGARSATPRKLEQMPIQWILLDLPVVCPSGRLTAGLSVRVEIYSTSRKIWPVRFGPGAREVDASSLAARLPPANNGAFSQISATVQYAESPPSI